MKIAYFVFCSFFFSFHSTFQAKCQPMNTIAILNHLQPYQDLLYDLQLQEAQSLSHKPGFAALTKKIRSAYSFIILELKQEFEGQENEVLYAEITFEERQGKMFLMKVYCENELRTPELESDIKNNKLVHDVVWTSNPNADVFVDEVLSNYLNIADSIASLALHCNTGDNYRPGYYSAIIIEKYEVVLQQINHMHSRSINHKDNYHLRNLEIRIPFHGSQTKPSRFDYQIGDMGISFSDSSSKNNKDCGDKIIAQIKAAKIAFEKKSH